MKIMMIGDISGELGIETVAFFLPALVSKHNIDLVIANGENAAGGLGITPDTFQTLMNIGVHVVTTGNHVWEKEEIFNIIGHDKRLLRPANYSSDFPGSGYVLIELNQNHICVINLIGREHMQLNQCPFRAADDIIRQVIPLASVILVDFHAVSTVEKTALGWYLDGRVSCVAGTHTHIQTADARILPHGTAYISDLGMVGPWNSVLGVEPEPMIQYYTEGKTDGFRLAEGVCVFNAVVIDVDEYNGKTRKITRIQKFYK